MASSFLSELATFFVATFQSVKPQGFQLSYLLRWRVKASLLNHPKHITHILNQDSGDGGDGVDVVFGVVGEVDAGHEIEVFEDCIQALADAGVEVTRWRVGIYEQDGLLSGWVGHVHVFAKRFIRWHK